MATARMIHRNISLDERLADVSLLARVLYTWGLPHTSDYGVLAAAPRRLKAQVVPLFTETPEEIEVARDELVEVGLWDLWEHDGALYVNYPTFERYQDIRKRTSTPRDGLPIPSQGVHTSVTKTQVVHSSGNFRELPGSVGDFRENADQGKGREGKGIEHTPPLPPPGGDCVLSPVDTSDDNTLPEYSHYLLLNYPKLVGLVERLYADAWPPRKRLRTVLAYVELLREPGCRLDESALVAAWEADPPWPGTSAESYMRHLHGANARRLDAEEEPDARASPPDREELVNRARGLYHRLFTEDLLFAGNAKQCEAIVAETYGQEVAAHAATPRRETNGP